MGLRPLTTVASAQFLKKKLDGAIFVDDLNKYINEYLKYKNILLKISKSHSYECKKMLQNQTRKTRVYETDSNL